MMRQFALWTALFALPFVILATQLHWGEAIEPAAYAYPASPTPACTVSPVPPYEDTFAPFHMRVPTNYDPTRQHPLLVMFSPAGANSHLTERWVGITHAATEAGYIVAFIGSIRMHPDNIVALSKQVRAIVNHWCIDTTRITFAGHSDGGSIAQLLTLLPDASAVRPRTIVASGAGLRDADFAEFQCPQGVDVHLFHGRKDTHFRGFGRSAATAWAQCMGCRQKPVFSNGCEQFEGCQGQLRLCEIDAGHYRWLPQIEDLLR